MSTPIVLLLLLAGSILCLEPNRPHAKNYMTNDLRAGLLAVIVLILLLGGLANG